ncbi:MAG TPA: tRNA (N(6)-L-threonylcarbamoyladenosine(37)-C(2))-methylthiotransferase [Nitrososphaerales archaeon]|nr:tRNA (N(6)-L-threonylcarbamoyladenosine(37)-C(2))-methylthiotransferase [Nitrososphaerales archaeon]
MEKIGVFVEGHGCSASLADTEIISGMIENDGLRLVEDENDADVAVLVTCSVKTVTEQRMLSRIRDLSKNGSKKVIVAGCLPKADPEKVMKIDQNLSMIGPNNLDGIIPAIHSVISGRQIVSLELKKLTKLGLPRTRLNSVIGIVEISSGCLSGCTFCQVKLVKGTVFSYPEEEIVNEARSLVSQGAKEIWLTSTDNSAYGKDSKTSLPTLIRKVAEIPGDFKIRVGMMNPLLTKRCLEELLDCFNLNKVFKFAHLPVQSGSNRVLRKMQRGYSVSDFESMIVRLREEIPNITLSTDMIVGFPSETEAEFEESMELLNRTRPDVLNLSRFGSRPGTQAAVMEDQISSDEAKKRSGLMAALSRTIQNKVNSQWIGWRGEVILDERVKGAVIGRNFAYKPCLIKDTDLKADEAILGSEVQVEVIGSTSSTLRATISSS